MSNETTATATPASTPEQRIAADIAALLNVKAPASKADRKGLFGTAYTRDALAGYLSANADGRNAFSGIANDKAYFATKQARWNYRAHQDRASAGQSAGTEATRTTRVHTVDATVAAQSLRLVVAALAERYDLDSEGKSAELPGVALDVRKYSLDRLAAYVTDAQTAMAAVVGMEDDARAAIRAAALAALVKYVRTVNDLAASRTVSDDAALAAIVAALTTANDVANDTTRTGAEYAAAEAALAKAWETFNKATAPRHSGLIDLSKKAAPAPAPAPAPTDSDEDEDEDADAEAEAEAEADAE